MDDNHAGVIVDATGDSLDRVTKLLAGINGGVYQAVGNALTRAAAAGRTAAKQPVTREYAISQSEFLSQTRNINHFVRDASGGLTLTFGFQGNVIPLAHFNTTVNSSG